MQNTPSLAWLRDLPKAGTIADMAKKEADILDRRAGLLEQIAAVDKRLSELRTEAEQIAAKHWPATEIDAAKAAQVAP